MNNEINFKSKIIVKYFNEFPIELKGKLDIYTTSDDEFIYVNHYAVTPDNDLKMYKQSLIKKDGIKEITIIEDLR